jgi:hypothetical protein
MEVIAAKTIEIFPITWKFLGTLRAAAFHAGSTQLLFGDDLR